MKQYTIKRKLYADSESEKKGFGWGKALATTAAVAGTMYGAKKGLFGNTVRRGYNTAYGYVGNALGSKSMINSAADDYARAITKNRAEYRKAYGEFNNRFDLTKGYNTTAPKTAAVKPQSAPTPAPTTSTTAPVTTPAAVQPSATPSPTTSAATAGASASPNPATQSMPDKSNTKRRRRKGKGKGVAVGQKMDDMDMYDVSSHMFSDESISLLEKSIVSEKLFSNEKVLRNQKFF